jgi:hypothetical protein
MTLTTIYGVVAVELPEGRDRLDMRGSHLGRASIADFEYEFRVVGREGVEPPKLSRRFYRPLGSPRALCRPSA